MERSYQSNSVLTQHPERPGIMHFFLASSFFCSQAESTFAHCPLGQSVGRYKSTTESNLEQSQSTLHTEEDRNRNVVLSFFHEGLAGLQPRRAFEHYVSQGFIEHKPDVALGTREATIEYLERLIENLPGARWEMIRTIAEGDFVFLHARFTPTLDAPAYAIADIFRLHNSVIVEHWDVVGHPQTQNLIPIPDS